MKVARATIEEIDSLNNLISELSAIGRYFSHKYPREAVIENKEDFEVLSKLVGNEDNDEMLSNICEHLNNMRWEVVLFNLRVLMDNCVDMESDTLDFNKEIKAGLELLEKSTAE